MTPQRVCQTIGNSACPKHPRWQKKRKPTSTCQNCWFIWFMRLLGDGALDVRLET